MKTLVEAKSLLQDGWTLLHEGTGESLRVWVESPFVPKCVLGVDRADFRPLAEFARELKAQAKEERPVPIPHIIATASAAIYSYGYNAETQVFEVRYKFSPNTLYSFANVPPEVFEGAKKADSLGRFISQTFPKGQTLYPMAKRDDSKPVEALKEAS